MMKRLTIMSLFGVLALGLVAAAYPLATANTKAERSDCPGEVLCPLTGREVCEDQCPITAEPTQRDTSRIDCPGQVKCPLNGELICRDQCPVTEPSKTNEPATTASDEAAELPPCCRDMR